MPAWQNLGDWLIKQQRRSSAGAALNSAGAQGRSSQVKWEQTSCQKRSHLPDNGHVNAPTYLSISTSHSAACARRGGGGGVSEPHHKLTVGSAVTRPTVPPWSSCSKNHPGLNWPSWSVFTHKNLHIWSEVLRYSNQIEGKFKYASLPNPRGNVPLMKAVYQEERKHSLRFNLLLLNDRIFFFFFFVVRKHLRYISLSFPPSLRLQVIESPSGGEKLITKHVWLKELSAR